MRSQWVRHGTSCEMLEEASRGGNSSQSYGWSPDGVKITISVEETKLSHSDPLILQAGRQSEG